MLSSTFSLLGSTFSAASVTMIMHTAPVCNYHRRFLSYSQLSVQPLLRRSCTQPPRVITDDFSPTANFQCSLCYDDYAYGPRVLSSTFSLLQPTFSAACYGDHAHSPRVLSLTISLLRSTFSAASVTAIMQTAHGVVAQFNPRLYCPRLFRSYAIPTELSRLEVV